MAVNSADIMAQDSIALDRASVRRVDADGHMHVGRSILSAAEVSDYRGAEIPDWEKLGLDPNKLYSLLRSADELEKAAPSFAGKPLTSVHRAQTAEDHDHDLVVGSVSNPRWDPPNLVGELVIWDGLAIDAVTSGKQCALSCGYRYRAVPEEGVYDGKSYSLSMKDIVGNHLSLVSAGRVPTAFVGDAALPAAHVGTLSPTPTPSPTTKEPKAMAKPAVALSRRAAAARGALTAYLRPKLAADASIDLLPILKGVTARNWKASKPKIAKGLATAATGKLAQDADLEDVIEMLDQLDEVVDAAPDEIADVIPAADPDAASDDDDDMLDRLRSVLSAKGMSDEDIDAVLAALKPEVDADAPVAAADAPVAAKPVVAAADAPVAPAKTAMDSAQVRVALDAAILVERARGAAALTAATNATRRDTIAQLNAVREAERAVRPYVGELAVAMDSAADVYGFVLESKGIDITGVDPSAFKAMVGMLPVPGAVAAPVAPKVRVAQDAAITTNRSAMFPNAARFAG